MKRVEIPTYTAEIYVAGSYAEALRVCRLVCDAIGLCVTVEPVSYVFTDGETDGVRVGLINYGRFPSSPDAILERGERLARLLIDSLGQQSASIVATDRTVWLINRPEDAGDEPK